MKKLLNNTVEKHGGFNELEFKTTDLMTNNKNLKFIIVSFPNSIQLFTEDLSCNKYVNMFDITDHADDIIKCLQDLRG